jgi:hypothetical protein
VECKRNSNGITPERYAIVESIPIAAESLARADLISLVSGGGQFLNPSIKRSKAHGVISEKAIHIDLSFFSFSGLAGAGGTGCARFGVDDKPRMRSFTPLQEYSK